MNLMKYGTADNSPDLSFQDIHRAETLLAKEKFKIKVDLNVRKKHGEIGMMCNQNCTKSITDFDYLKHKNNNMI